MKPLAIAALGLSLFAAAAVAQDKEAEKSVLVATVPAQRGSLPDTLTSYGTAEPQPGSTHDISLPRAGQVLQISVRIGQKLRQGDALLTFSADPAAMMAWNQAVAALNLAREERAHVEQLFKQQLATRSQLAQADKAVADAQAALDALRLQGGGEPLETVTAPFDAIVMNLPVNAGDRVQAGAALATLLRADAVGVMIGVEPADRGKLQPGENVDLEPLEGGAAVAGTIATVGAMLDPRTRKVEATVTVARDGVLPGTAFRAIVTVGEFQGWIVPRLAVQNDGKTDLVFQLADSKAVAVPVKIVGTNGDSTVVEGDLDPSRPLVTEGSYQLSDGMAVRTAPGGPNAEKSSGRKS
jgi:membrane fusion protein (multidrug efflux system)